MPEFKFTQTVIGRMNLTEPQVIETFEGDVLGSLHLASVFLRSVNEDQMQQLVELVGAKNVAHFLRDQIRSLQHITHRAREQDVPDVGRLACIPNETWKSLQQQRLALYKRKQEGDLAADELATLLLFDEILKSVLYLFPSPDAHAEVAREVEEKVRGGNDG